LLPKSVRFEKCSPPTLIFVGATQKFFRFFLYIFAPTLRRLGVGFLSALAVGGDSHYFIRKVQPKDDELSLDGKPQGVIPRYI
jgi:hypothetical protein